MADDYKRTELSARLISFRKTLIDIEKGVLPRGDFDNRTLGLALFKALLGENAESAADDGWNASDFSQMDANEDDSRSRIMLLESARTLISGRNVDFAIIYAGLRGIVDVAQTPDLVSDGSAPKPTERAKARDMFAVPLNDDYCLLSLECPPESNGAYVGFLPEIENMTWYKRNEFDSGVILKIPEGERYIYARASFPDGDRSDFVFLDTYFIKHGISVSLGTEIGPAFIPLVASLRRKRALTVRVEGRKNITVPPMTVILSNDGFSVRANEAGTLATFSARELTDGFTHYRLPPIKRWASRLSVVVCQDGCRPIIWSWEVR